MTRTATGHSAAAGAHRPGRGVPARRSTASRRRPHLRLPSQRAGAHLGPVADLSAGAPSAGALCRRRDDPRRRAAPPPAPPAPPPRPPPPPASPGPPAGGGGGWSDTDPPPLDPPAGRRAIA